MTSDQLPPKRSQVWKDIRTIVTSLKREDRDYIRELPKEQIILLHHTLGRALRNEFRSGKYGKLFIYCDEQQTAESRSFDSISGEAIKLVWNYLKDAQNSD